MDNIFSRLLPSRLTGMDKAVVGTAAKKRNQTGIAITVGVFFDGTGNNRNNVAQRHIAQYNEAHPDKPVNQEDGVKWSGSYPKHGKAGNSYAGGYSNVSILEAMNNRRDLEERQISVYVEGIGTVNDMADATIGMAFGSASTGIPKKVARGIGLIAEKIAKILKQEEDSFVEQVTIDVFGFSRGAAAARHFISLLHATPTLAARLQTPTAKVKIKFVGIFDTVSSYGLSFKDDIEQLGLRIGGNAQKVVHITSGDEYRQNFSLTDITSSLGIGYELTLPGVHSDIGGGYSESEYESRILHFEDRDRLINHGWYTEEEVPIRYEHVNDRQGNRLFTKRSVVGIRKNVRPDYQYIPLAIMAACAKKPGQMDLEMLSKNGRFGKFTIGPDHELAQVQAVIQGHVAGHGVSGRHSLKLLGDVRPGVLLPLSPAEVRRLRNRYLHRSASIGLGLGGDKRIGMGERLEDKKPHREIYHG